MTDEPTTASAGILLGDLADHFPPVQVEYLGGLVAEVEDEAAAPYRDALERLYAEGIVDNALRREVERLLRREVGER
jgi:hypothetical protein